MKPTSAATDGPTGIEETLAHFRTAYAPKHHPDLTPQQQVRINAIDAYRAERQPRLKQKTPADQVNLILALGWVAVASIGVAIGLAMATGFDGFDTEEQLRAYRATRHEAVAVEVAAK